MNHEGDVQKARESYLSDPQTNLQFLLEQRFTWMDSFLENSSHVVELGGGAGFSQFFMKTPHKITDVAPQPWLDDVVDALALPYANNSVDALICSHMIHHLAQPKKFFQEALRVLKPGGRIVINELHTSWLMRCLLRVMRHEGWSFQVDVFSETQTSNNPVDPWSANCAIPHLLFSDKEKFETEIAGFQIVHDKFIEVFILMLSGGVIAKTKVPLLPFWALKIFRTIDSLLVGLFPQVFALGRQVVLEKTTPILKSVK